jgi:8-amino-7-oxononanoate synthase
MADFDAELTARLEALRDEGLFRQLRRVDSPQAPHVQVDGRTLLNFSSNDYLGLANDPVLKEAAIKAVERYGAGAGASRLISGSLVPHEELDEAIAKFKGLPAALSFSSGYAAAVGTICALLAQNDVIILDKLVHACIVDAARLSGAKIRVFDHNDPADLEPKLKWAAERNGGTEPVAPSRRPGNRKPQILVVTESVFSMDGDHAPLRELVELKEKFAAWLMVDEAHATGLYGANGRGLAEQLGVSARIEIHMGTLGKALGSSGGYICGSRALVEYLVNRARSFIFSTAPVPAAAAAATAAIRFVQSAAGRERRDILWRRISEAGSNLKSAIVPIMIGDETKAVDTASALRERGLLIPAVRYPTVARNQARLRLTLTAAHTNADIEELLGELRSVGIAL